MKVVLLMLAVLVGCSKSESPLTLTMAKTKVANFSLKVEEADFIPNFILLDHVMETFFKTSQSGTPEPSGVQEWSSSIDQLDWTFTLKAGLKDEDGKALTPSYWCEGIKKIMPKLPKPENMILLSRLEGWKEFVAGKGQLPISCDDKELKVRMRFKERPEGILDYLSMPVLGFWAAADEKDFRATGVFKVAKTTGDKFELERVRPSKEGFFNRVVIRYRDSQEIKDSPVGENEIVYSSLSLEGLKQSSNLIRTFPTQMTFVEFNDAKTGPFGDPKVRREVYSAISRFKKGAFLHNDEVLKTDSVYYDVQPKIPFDDRAMGPTPRFKKLRILGSASSVGATVDAVRVTVEEVFKKMADEVEIIQLDTSDEKWQTVINRDYDVRIAAVDAGTHPNKWVTEMMFCSHQGITFIDPKGAICKGLKGIKDTEGDRVGELVNRVTAENYVLLPLFNRAALLYVGKGIDDTGVYAGSLMPRLDRLKAL